jgi:hypothetical protein
MFRGVCKLRMELLCGYWQTKHDFATLLTFLIRVANSRLEKTFVSITSLIKVWHFWNGSRMAIPALLTKISISYSQAFYNPQGSSMSSLIVQLSSVLLFESSNNTDFCCYEHLQLFCDLELLDLELLFTKSWSSTGN